MLAHGEDRAVGAPVSLRRVIFYAVRQPVATPRGLRTRKRCVSGAFLEALHRTRTDDPFLTMEVLYQLS